MTSVLIVVAIIYTIVISFFYLFDKSLRVWEGVYFSLGCLVMIELVVAFVWYGVFLT